MGWERLTEVPLTVEIKTIKGGYWSFFFFIKFIITREFFFFFENQRELFDPYIHKVLSLVKSPRTLHIHEIYGFCNGFEVGAKYTQEKPNRLFQVLNEVFLHTNYLSR